MLERLPIGISWIGESRALLLHPPRFMSSLQHVVTCAHVCASVLGLGQVQILGNIGGKDNLHPWLLAEAFQIECNENRGGYTCHVWTRGS